MIELNKEYTYSQICEELGWKQFSGGNAKKAQIKEIESSYEFYHPMNKKTHKEKKSYVFTAQLKTLTEPSRANNTSSNNKNIQPMMDYLLMRNGIDEEWHSWTVWWCDMLELFYSDVCNIVYQDKDEINGWCKEHSINNSAVLCEYVSTAKRVLKNLFLTALRNLEKKDLVEYDKAIHFIYKLGERTKTTGSIYSVELFDNIMELETNVCNEINEDRNLSDKMKGRQLLMLIYKTKELTDGFKELMLLDIMGDENIVGILNDDIDTLETIRPSSDNVHITEDTPIIDYHQVLSIGGIEDVYEYDEDMCESLAMQISNIIRNKVRKAMLNKHWTNKYTDEVIYTFANSESDILVVEELLYQYFDDKLIAPTIESEHDDLKELDELFGNYTIDEIDEEILDKVFGVA